MSSFSSTYLDLCRSQLALEQAKSLAETNNWQHLDKPKVHADWEILYRELAGAIDELAANSPRAQQLIQKHYEITCRFYPPSKEAYIGLALFYQENADMRNYHNAYHPNMVEFLNAAIPIYAEEHL